MKEFFRTNIDRVAVTGATGFVGRHLVSRLVSEGYAVRTMTRRSDTRLSGAVEEFQADLLDPEADLSAFLDGVDALIHCAGEVRDQTHMQALNVDAVSRLLGEARSRKLHWVHLSSVGVYGADRDGTISEDTPMRPANIYEQSKASADKMIMALDEGNAMTWTILRPANIYGEGMPSGGLFRFSDAVQTGIFRSIGDGKLNAHYIHVENVVDALILCLQDTRATGRVYNLSDTNHIADCASIISKFYNKPLNVGSIPEWCVRGVTRLASLVPGLPINSSTANALLSKASYSSSRIKNELGYRLRVPINDGLRRFLQWKKNEQDKLPAATNNAGSATSIPLAWILWVSFFCFSTIAALLFQKLVVPSIDGMHAGHGLLPYDAIKFHLAATSFAAQMRVEGLLSWPMSSGGGNVAVLGFLYYLWGEDPSLVIPVNAALHASGGVVLFLIGRQLLPGRAGTISAVLAAALFVGFPSALNWYGQVHKDGYAILGLLAIIYAWVRWVNSEQQLLDKSLFLLFGLCGAGLLAFVRPYGLQLLWPVLMMVYITLVIFHKQIKHAKSFAIWTLFIGVLPILLVAVMAKSSTLLIHASESRQQSLQEGNATCPHADTWIWEDSNWLPDRIERNIKNASVVRMSATCTGYDASATIDRDSAPRNIFEVIRYLPRALQVGLFAPFPDTWLNRVSPTQLVGAMEIAVWYLFAPGVLFIIFRRTTSSSLAVVVFALAFLAIHSYASPNLGTLHRVRYPFILLLISLGGAGWALWFSERPLVKWLSSTRRSSSALVQKDVYASQPGEMESSTERSQLKRSGLLVSALTAISFLMFFVRDVLMSQEFGIGFELDAFYIAFLLPMFLVNVISIPLGAAFIPRYQNARHSKGDSGQRVVSAYSFIAIVGALVMAGLFLLLGPWLLVLVGWGFGEVQLTLALELLLYGALLIAFSAMVILANSVLNAHSRFSLPAIAQLVVPVSAISTLLILAAFSGIISVAMGMVIGQVLNLIIVILAVRKEKVYLSPVWRDALIELKTALPLIFALIASALFVNSATVIDSTMATTLGGGSVGAYSLGMKIVLFATGVLGVGVATVLLPYFSEMVARNKHAQGKSDLTYFLRIATLICAPIGIVIFISAESIIQFLFLGGKVDDKDIGVVAGVTAFGVIQLPFFVCQLILIKYSNALQQVWVIFGVALFSLLLNVGLNLILMEPMGVAGLALATSLAQFVATVLLLAFMTLRGHVNIVSTIMLLLLWLLYMTIILCLYFNSFVGVIVAAIAIAVLLLNGRLGDVRLLQHRLT